MRTFAVVLCLVTPWTSIRADDDVDRRVKEGVARFASEDAAERDAAERDLVSLGSAARPALESAADGAKDPEVSSRIESVLKRISLQEAEDFAIQRIAANEPFPETDRDDKGGDLESGITVANAIKHISESFGIAVTIDQRDPDLRLEADRVRVEQGMGMPNRDAAEFLLVKALKWLDATYVVHDGAVIVVRMTAPVLVAKIRNEGRAHFSACLELLLRPFVEYGRSSRRWTYSMLNDVSRMTNGARERWLRDLRDFAADETRLPEDRAAALVGVSYYLGTTVDAQPDVDGVFLPHALSSTGPWEVRREAIRGLMHGLTDDAHRTVLDLLDQGTPELREEVLFSALELSHPSHCVAHYLHDEGRPYFARFMELLRKLSESEDREVALAALCNRAACGDVSTLDAIVDAGPLNTLRARYHQMCFARGKPESEAIRSYARHEDEQTRAVYACVTCGRRLHSAPDAAIEELLRLTGDPAPVVRFYAARMLDWALEERLAKGTERKSQIAEGLKKRLEVEADPRVRAAIEEAQRRLPPPK